MYGCESWPIKKAECQRIDAFELWCWRRLLRVPWTARRSNQSILKEISPEYSLEGLMLKLKLQYFGHLRWRVDSLEKNLMPGGIGGRRRRGRQRMRWHHRLDALEFEWTLGVGDRQGDLACCDSWGCKESDMTERLNWTELNWWSRCHLLYCFGFRFIHRFCVSCLKNILQHLLESWFWWSWILLAFFCLSVKLLISPSCLNEILAGYSNLGCRFSLSSL